MPYTFKPKDLNDIPVAGEERTLVSRRSYVQGDLVAGETVYVFAEDDATLGPKGGLAARAVLVSADKVGGEWYLRLQFDGTELAVPLPTPALDPFSEPHKYDVPAPGEGLSSIHEVLIEIAAIRRKTTRQPIHALSEMAGRWLDYYHFRHQKTEVMP